MKPFPRFLVDRWIIPRVFHLTVYTFPAWDHWTAMIDVGIKRGNGRWMGKTLTIRVPRRAHKE